VVYLLHRIRSERHAPRNERIPRVAHPLRIR
jgi:hypothetical protein